MKRLNKVATSIIFWLVSVATFIGLPTWAVHRYYQLHPDPPPPPPPVLQQQREIHGDFVHFTPAEGWNDIWKFTDPETGNTIYWGGNPVMVFTFPGPGKAGPSTGQVIDHRVDGQRTPAKKTY